MREEVHGVGTDEILAILTGSYLLLISKTEIKLHQKNSSISGRRNRV